MTHPRSRARESVPLEPRDARVPRKIRYSSEEWSMIVKRAEACRCEPARYVRETSLGVLPRGGRAQPAAAVIDDLRRIALALAQLAATAKATGAMPEALTVDAALTDVLATVRRLT